MEQDIAAFERQVQVNYLGSVRCIKAALPGMLRRRRGRIVLVGSEGRLAAGCRRAVQGTAGGAGAASPGRIRSRAHAPARPAPPPPPSAHLPNPFPPQCARSLPHWECWALVGTAPMPPQSGRCAAWATACATNSRVRAHCRLLAL